MVRRSSEVEVGRTTNNYGRELSNACKTEKDAVNSGVLESPAINFPPRIKGRISSSLSKQDVSIVSAPPGSGTVADEEPFAAPGATSLPGAVERGSEKKNNSFKYEERSHGVEENNTGTDNAAAEEITALGTTREQVIGDEAQGSDCGRRDHRQKRKKRNDRRDDDVDVLRPEAPARRAGIRAPSEMHMSSEGRSSREISESPPGRTPPIVQADCSNSAEIIEVVCDNLEIPVRETGCEPSEAAKHAGEKPARGVGERGTGTSGSFWPGDSGRPREDASEGRPTDGRATKGGTAEHGKGDERGASDGGAADVGATDVGGAGEKRRPGWWERLTRGRFGKSRVSTEVSPPRGSSSLETVFNGVNVLTGVGILATPYALGQAGWLAVLLLPLTAALYFLTAGFLRACMDHLPPTPSSDNPSSHSSSLSAHSSHSAHSVQSSLSSHPSLHTYPSLSHHPSPAQLALSSPSSPHLSPPASIIPPPAITSYPDIGFAAFGRTGRLLTSLLLYSELFAVSIELLILEGDSLAHLFPSFASAGVQVGPSLHLSASQVFLILAALVVLPTVLLRSLSLLAYVAVGGLLAALVTVVGVAWVAAVGADGVGGADGSTAAATTSAAAGGAAAVAVASAASSSLLRLQGVPGALGIFGFCFSGHAVFPTIYRSMDKPQHFNWVLIICFAVCTCIYGGIAILGYSMYGSTVASQITLNLPPSLTASRLVLWTTVISPLTKFAITVTPIALAVESSLSSYLAKRSTPDLARCTPYCVPHCKHSACDCCCKPTRPFFLPKFGTISSKTVVSIAVRTLLVVLSAAAGLLLPFFALVMTLIGSVLSISISLLLPTACHLSIKWRQLSRVSVVCHVAILLGGSVVAVMGTVYAVRGICCDGESH